MINQNDSGLLSSTRKDVVESLSFINQVMQIRQKASVTNTARLLGEAYNDRLAAMGEPPISEEDIHNLLGTR